LQIARIILMVLFACDDDDDDDDDDDENNQWRSMPSMMLAQIPMPPRRLNLALDLFAQCRYCDSSLETDHLLITHVPVSDPESALQNSTKLQRLFTTGMSVLVSAPSPTADGGGKLKSPV
jgi:hypothetical protein